MQMNMHQPCKQRACFTVSQSRTQQIFSIFNSDKQTYRCLGLGWSAHKVGPYLNQEDDKEVEIGNSSKLFKQVLW